MAGKPGKRAGGSLYPYGPLPGVNLRRSTAQAIFANFPFLKKVPAAMGGRENNGKDQGRSGEGRYSVSFGSDNRRQSIMESITINIDTLISIGSILLLLSGGILLIILTWGTCWPSYRIRLYLVCLGWFILGAIVALKYLPDPETFQWNRLF